MKDPDSNARALVIPEPFAMNLVRYQPLEEEAITQVANTFVAVIVAQEARPEASDVRTLPIHGDHPEICSVPPIRTFEVARRVPRISKPYIGSVVQIPIYAQL
jgi:hypothetical protein